MFRKKLIPAMMVGVITLVGCSGLALASDGVYESEQSNIIVVGDDTETEGVSEVMSETETETTGFTVNTDGFSYIDDGTGETMGVETELVETDATSAPTEMIQLNVNTRIKAMETETETESETESETEAETEERTTTLPKTGDFSGLDEIFNYLQEILWGLR